MVCQAVPGLPSIGERGEVGVLLRRVALRVEVGHAGDLDAGCWPRPSCDGDVPVVPCADAAAVTAAAAEVEREDQADDEHQHAGDDRGQPEPARAGPPPRPSCRSPTRRRRRRRRRGPRWRAPGRCRRRCCGRSRRCPGVGPVVRTVRPVAAGGGLVDARDVRARVEARCVGSSANSGRGGRSGGGGGGGAEVRRAGRSSASARPRGLVVAQPPGLGVRHPADAAVLVEEHRRARLGGLGVARGVVRRRRAVTGAGRAPGQVRHGERAGGRQVAGVAARAPTGPGCSAVAGPSSRARARSPGPRTVVGS